MRKNIMDIKTNKKLSVREAARRFGISPNTVCTWRKNIKPKGQRKQSRTKKAPVTGHWAPGTKTRRTNDEEKEQN